MKKAFLGKVIGISLISISALSVAVGTLAWFSGANGESQKHIDGEIGLRGYFYTGNGEDVPYEIVLPRHLYNLCRLQNLGLFPESKSFQIGHKHGSVYEVITGYENDGTPIWGDYLDMAGTSIKPIGNEATPFVGNFDGKGIPVKNLDVYGNPEDIGFFGYVGHEGTVTGLVLQDIDIYSLGYSNTSDDDTYKMYNPTIDGEALDPQVDSLFDESAPYFERFTNVSFVDANGVENNLTKDNGIHGTVIDCLNYEPNVIHFNKNVGGEIIENTAYNGYFKITIPQDHAQDRDISSDDLDAIASDPFKYSCRVSSSLLSEEKIIDIDGNPGNDKAIMLNITKLLSSSTDTNKFNALGQNMHVEARLSICATVEESGYKYSRVIQSYSINFYSNNDQATYHCNECNTDYIASSLVAGHCPVNDGHELELIKKYHCDGCHADYLESSLVDGHCPNNSGHKLKLIPSYSAVIYCDFVAMDNPQHHVTNYHHGNNIGFLAGHLDGNMEYCYVYGSPKEDENDTRYGCNFYLNDSDITAVETESDIGLIGEVGTNVVSSIDPDYGVDGEKDTGVMNFTRIYNGIRRDFNVNETVKAGHYNSPSANYVSFDSAINTSNTSLFNDYEPYLRGKTFDGQKSYLLGTDYAINPGDAAEPTWFDYTLTQSLLNNKELNAVDFLWNSLIESNENNHNGLGVFKIATYYDSAASNPSSDDVLKSMGKTRIYNVAGKDKVYFSTAEFDHTSSGNNTQTAWGSYEPKRASTIPSYSEIDSYNYQFERDFNYCFELDLSQMRYTNGYNFMSNTKSDFLANYLSYKLISNAGTPITRGTKKFGFMFKASNGVNSYDLESLSAYMPVGYPKTDKKQYGDEYYPSSCIAFSITNQYGANVSVVGNNADITIYKHDPTSSNKNNIEAMYTMRSRNVNEEGSIDQHRYFKFDVQKVVDGETCYGVTGTKAVENGNDMKDGGDALYAHIFKLKPGDYVIGSSADKTTANIYFLAVQGQENGDIGTDVSTEISSRLENVDFLTEAPTRDTFQAGLSKANFNFSANFNDENNKFTVSTTKNTPPASNYITINYNESPVFVTYLSTYLYGTGGKYYVKEVEKTISEVIKSH